MSILKNHRACEFTKSAPPSINFTKPQSPIWFILYIKITSDRNLQKVRYKLKYFIPMHII